MSNLHLVLSEIRFRRFNFLLSAAAITVAGMLLVAGPTIVDSFQRDTNNRIAEEEEKSQEAMAVMIAGVDDEIATYQVESAARLEKLNKETIRAMRDLGFNLRILHRDTNLADFYGNFHSEPMPEEYIYRLADETSITTIVHLVATLQVKTKWNDRTVLVAGVLPEVSQSHVEKKAPMGYQIEPGTVLVGYELAQGREVGDTLEFEGREFIIAQILPEQGTAEDISLMFELHDAQAVLGMEGQITQILALGCKCSGDRIPVIRQELGAVMPEVQVIEERNLATIREEERDRVAAERAEQLAGMEATRAETLASMESTTAAHLAEIKETRGDMQRSMTVLVSVTTPLVVVVAAALVGLLAWLNVRERLGEIGLLRAVGRQTSNIAGLFLGKAVLLGLLGGLFGCVLGYVLAWQASQAMQIPQSYLQIDPFLLVATLLGAPLVAAMASYLPMLHAVRQDPAGVLLEH